MNEKLKKLFLQEENNPYLIAQLLSKKAKHRVFNNKVNYTENALSYIIIHEYLKNGIDVDKSVEEFTKLNQLGFELEMFE